MGPLASIAKMFVGSMADEGLRQENESLERKIKTLKAKFSLAKKYSKTIGDHLTVAQGKISELEADKLVYANKYYDILQKYNALKSSEEFEVVDLPENPYGDA